MITMSRTENNKFRQAFVTTREELLTAVDEQTVSDEDIYLLLQQLDSIYLGYRDACVKYEDYLKYYEQVDNIARLLKESARIKEDFVEICKDVEKYVVAWRVRAEKGRQAAEAAHAVRLDNDKK